jgi:membrane-anchored protein YejM (alkaline phosphatase superfamily)
MNYFENFKKNWDNFYLFQKVNFWILAILNIFYIFFTNIPQSKTFLFLLHSWVSNTFMISLGVSIVFFVMYALIPSKKTIYGLMLPLSIPIYSFFLTDVVQYKLFKYHINGMVLNQIMASVKGESDSVSLGFSTWITAILVVGIFIFIHMVTQKNIKKINSISLLSSKRINKYALIALFLFLVTEKVAYSIYDLVDEVSVISYNNVFPFYQPLTIKRTARKFGYKDNRDRVKISSEISRLQYPLNEITSRKPEKQYNILWILWDAVRYDKFSEEIMPNAYALSKKSQVFMNHYSGGNASRFGVFSMFYGVYGTYWHQFLAERRSPVFMDELQKQDYDFNILASTYLASPEFRKTCFVNVPEYIHDSFEGENALQKDPQITDNMVEFINTRKKDKPFFGFMFFDAPHGPYCYPEDEDLFQPSRSSVNYMTVTKKDTLILKNSYKNAIHWNDMLTKKILDALEENGYMDNTIIVISGDHGEEFYERGYFGHTNAFTDMQTKVPMIIYHPDMEPKEYNYLTSHHDLSVTFMEQIGVKNPAKDYSHGKNIFDDSDRDYVVSAGWDDASIINNENTLVFGTQSYKTQMTLHDDVYKLILEKDKRKQVMKKFYPYVGEVQRDITRFSK